MTMFKVPQKLIKIKVLRFILYAIVFIQMSTILFGVIIMVKTTFLD